MKTKQANRSALFLLMVLLTSACSVPKLVSKGARRDIPTAFSIGEADSALFGTGEYVKNTSWKSFYQDPFLSVLIDSALSNNQELNIILREIEVSKNEVMARKGEYLPSVTAGVGSGFEKAARYTQVGASEATTEIKPGKEMPEPLGDFWVGARATWEVDIWHKLRNARKAAAHRYLASEEGSRFLITNLVAEIATSYYELLALDSQLQNIRQNIKIQKNALKMVRLQKEATRVTELAVKRFEAQVLNTESMEYEIRQQITETENRINFLVGRYPQPVNRNREGLSAISPEKILVDRPVEILVQRPDIREAEQQLTAARLDVDVARASFYPSLGLSASLGTQAFNPAYLAKMPLSLFSTLMGDFVAPLINKNAIRATYLNANEQQIQAAYRYDQVVLNAFLEVSNLTTKITNLERLYALKSREVEALTESVAISNRLFSSAKADYTEVLLTQREVVESQFGLIETKMKQLNAIVSLYRALGGGGEKQNKTSETPERR